VAGLFNERVAAYDINAPPAPFGEITVSGQFAPGARVMVTSVVPMPVIVPPEHATAVMTLRVRPEPVGLKTILTAFAVGGRGLLSGSRMTKRSFNVKLYEFIAS
jgi:hypothetical protein